MFQIKWKNYLIEFYFIENLEDRPDTYRPEFLLLFVWYQRFGMILINLYFNVCVCF